MPTLTFNISLRDPVFFLLSVITSVIDTDDLFSENILLFKDKLKTL